MSQSPPPSPDIARSESPAAPAPTVAADPGPNLAALGTQSPSIWPTLIPVTLISMGVVLIVVVAWVTIRNRGAASARPASAKDRLAELKMSASPGPIGPSVDAATIVSAATADVRRVAAELSASLDQKSRGLEELIAAADRRIATLSALEAAVTERRSAGPVLADSLAPAVRPPTIRAAAYMTANTGRNTSQGVLASDESPSPAGNALQDEVVRLSRQGLTSVQIAQKLNQHVGTIELVLALRR